MAIGIMSMSGFTFSVSGTCENAMAGITNEIQVKKSPKVIFTIIEGCLRSFVQTAAKMDAQ
jgi:hypothetical protein